MSADVGSAAPDLAHLSINERSDPSSELGTRLMSVPNSGCFSTSVGLRSDDRRVERPCGSMRTGKAVDMFSFASQRLLANKETRLLRDTRPRATRGSILYPRPLAVLDTSQLGRSQVRSAILYPVHHIFAQSAIASFLYRHDVIATASQVTDLCHCISGRIEGDFAIEFPPRL